MSASSASGAEGAALAVAVDAVVEAFGPRAVLDAPLGSRTTYRVGGTAAVYVEVDSVDDLRSLGVALSRAGGPVPFLVLGQGSNLLVADSGFPGVVTSLGRFFDWVEITDRTLRAGGATRLPVVARRSAGTGLTGLEWAVGVPGSVGGALRMNAGGHGSDTASVLVRYRSFDLEDRTHAEQDAAHLAFGYRQSALGPGEIVEWAEFSLDHSDPGRAQDAIADIVRWRREHQPGGSNAGSVFTNPGSDSAGRLVELSGLKGHRMGSARVSEKHANFIQADEGGSADDVHRLIEHVQAEVARRIGVNLETEVRLVGFRGVTLPAVHARA